MEFVKCVSAEELRARLNGGRPFSAVMADANLAALDRDLIDAGRQAGCAVVVVEERRARRDWTGLGAQAVLIGAFEPADLLQVLRAHASTVATGQLSPEVSPEGLGGLDRSGGRDGTGAADATTGVVVAVCGSGGTGASTMAMATAQGLARCSGGPGAAPVLLADLARRGDQAVLHDARDVVPGVQELVEAHRNGRLAPEEVVSLTFDVAERGYHLLLGLRRASAWATLRPRAFEAALGSARRAYGSVVCDIEADLETERQGGSLDVEERNLMARSAVAAADVVLAVGLPGVKGLHSLIRLMGDLSAADFPLDRLVPVINRAPRSRRARAELATALAELAGATPGSTPSQRRGTASSSGPSSPVFLSERRLDEVAGHASRLPGALAEPLAAAVSAVLARSGRRSTEVGHPQPVAPGSLGHWRADEETALG